MDKTQIDLIIKNLKDKINKQNNEIKKLNKKNKEFEKNFVEIYKYLSLYAKLDVIKIEEFTKKTNNEFTKIIEIINQKLEQNVVDLFQDSLKPLQIRKGINKNNKEE